ncbi:hypothetical protein [Pseudoteredinibacter isoporae]|uniref:hypothetical protein n=1 Tax=Pseudoteredinibacter isoporae TaxID=570281 RepID=UPI003108875F
MKKTYLFLLVAAGGLLASWVMKSMNKPTLKYFKPSEFGVWYPLMSNDLLLKLDKFREAWGGPVIVSSADGAVGRRDDHSRSQHNVNVWGEVRAVDIFPKVGGRYIETSEELERAFDIAKAVGFSGIGVYTDTSPGHMLHVDVRSTRDTIWSRIAGTYKYGAPGLADAGIVA